MRAISLWQPWASAVILGHKRIETRHWSTPFTGRMAIHAAKRWTREERDDAAMFARQIDPRLATPPLGAILGTVRLVRCEPGCVENDPPDELPEGLFEKDGRPVFVCLGCDQTRELLIDPTEFGPDTAYCGGSPRCLP